MGVTKEELKQNIAIILSQAGTGKLRVYRLKFPEILLIDPHFVAEPGGAQLNNEQIDLLRLLYSQCSSELRTEFMDLLLPKGPQIILIVHKLWFVCHAAFALERLEPLKPYLTGASVFTIPAWGVLEEKLALESHHFRENDFDWIDDIVRDRLQKSKKEEQDSRDSVPWHAARVKSKVAKIRYLRLKRALFEGHNPEINTDAQALASRLGTLGFRKEILVAFNALDSKLHTAGQPLDFKSCMDLTRTIYEEIVEDAAKAAAKKRHKVEPQYGKPFQPWAQFLENEGIITSDEKELAQKLYNYLSNAGSHVLGSAPEQARVSRNMVVELGLIIVGRVQNVL